jgi:branched-subunit amino acid aminotransferase/4-amino-4-deoxychorismate lyase
MQFTHQSINGQVLPNAQALVPLNDVGMLRAYAVFDYFRVLGGVPVFLEDHLDRLFRSAELMHLELSWDRSRLREMILELIAVNRADNAGFRVIVTGGNTEDGFTPGTPNCYMTLHPLPSHSPEDYIRGSKLITSAYERDMPTVKTCIYIQSLLVRKAMKEAGAVEVLYHGDGKITECSRSNIFFVSPDNMLITPEDGMLRGVTRKQVLEIAGSLNIRVDLRCIHLDELPEMKESFITSTTRGVLPIVQIDKTRIGTGTPGNMTLQLHDAFEQRVKEIVARGAIGVSSSP